MDSEADGGGHHHHADEARLEVGGEVLPLELTIHVLSFLDARDRLSLALVSRPFRVLADDDLQWRRLYAREWFREGSEAPNGQAWERRPLPRVKDVTSWKLLFRLRTQTERAHFPRKQQPTRRDVADDDDAHGGDGDGDGGGDASSASSPPPPQLVGEDGDDGGEGDDGGDGEVVLPKEPWVAREKRNGRSYCLWGDYLRQKLPQVTTDEDDPVQLKEDRDIMEVRSLYLICREEFLSALSYKLTPEEQFKIYFSLGDVTHEFSIYQRHFPHNPAHLREWYEAACEAFEKSLQTTTVSVRDKSSTLCAWAGVIRDYANSGVGGDEQTDRLFQLAYAKYQEALELYGRKRPDYLLIENWAYAIREHANFNVRINNHPEAERRFDECFSKYEMCNSLHSDSIVLSNWADALREKAEIVDGEGRDSLFKQAHLRYKLSFALDAMDCLTLCNWAMLYCLRARTCHARAQALREDIRRCQEDIIGSDEEAVRAKEVEAAKAEADYRRLVATGKAKLEFGIAEGDLWTYFCMARLCAAACEAEECREWMTKCASKRYLSKAKESQLADFAFVKDLAWFQDMQHQQQAEATTRLHAE